MPFLKLPPRLFSAFRRTSGAIALAMLFAISPVLAKDVLKDDYKNLSKHLDNIHLSRNYRIHLDELLPSQFAVGMGEVRFREKEIEEMGHKKLLKYLEEKVTKVVIGPEGRIYLVDGHHLVTALGKAGIKEVLVQVHADWSDLSEDAFFEKMEKEKLMWLYDENGKGPLSPRKLPKTFSKLKDDRFRSLVWKLIKKEAIEKADVPFAEFKWGAYLRGHISQEELKTSPSQAFDKAVELAHAPEASNLPGYIPGKGCLAKELEKLGNAP